MFYFIIIRPNGKLEMDEIRKQFNLWKYFYFVHAHEMYIDCKTSSLTIPQH